MKNLCYMLGEQIDIKLNNQIYKAFADSAMKIIRTKNKVIIQLNDKDIFNAHLESESEIYRFDKLAKTILKSGYRDDFHELDQKYGDIADTILYDCGVYLSVIHDFSTYSNEKIELLLEFKDYKDYRDNNVDIDRIISLIKEVLQIY